jgi:hypothetical protein
VTLVVWAALGLLGYFNFDYEQAARAEAAAKTELNNLPLKSRQKLVEDVNRLRMTTFAWQRSARILEENANLKLSRDTVLATAAVKQATQQRESAAESLLYAFLVWLALALVQVVLFCRLLGLAWSQVPKDQRWLGPWTAVLPLFIPLLNVVWLFVAVVGLRNALNRAADRANVARRASAILTWGFCILAVIALPTPIIMPINAKFWATQIGTILQTEGRAFAFFWLVSLAPTLLAQAAGLAALSSLSRTAATLAAVRTT